MAVTFRSYGSSPGSNSTSCVITKPAGLTAGDLMIAQVVGRSNYSLGTFTAPGGWTSIRQDNVVTAYNLLSSALFWKIADAADVAGSNFIFTTPGTGTVSNRGAITAWYGHDPTTPINANEGQANATASTTVTSDGLTPSAADCVICLFCAIRDDNTQNGYAIAVDNPASWAEAYDLPSDLSMDLGLSLGYATRPETSATGNGTATTSVSAANIGQLVAVAPIPAITEKTSSDSGSGADAKTSGNPLATLVKAETGSGLDAKASGNPRTTLVKAETGSGVDVFVSLEQLEAKASSDTGSGADAYVSLVIFEARFSSDVGLGVEGAPVLSAILTGSETGSGIDAIIARLLAAVDTGTGTEASSLFQDLSKNLFATELGQGTDALVVKRGIFAGGEGTKFFGGGHKPPHRAS